MSMMKSRLSFVTRRTSSAVPPPSSPKANGATFDNIDEGSFPIPEPMTITHVPRMSELKAEPSSSSIGLVTTTTTTLKDEDTSPKQNLSKSRSKSTVDMKKKLSSETTGTTPATAATANSSDDINNATLPMTNIFPNSIREGFLRKKGVVNLAWKKRFIVLLPHQLAYYDELPVDHTIVPKGFINLNSITRVTHHDVSNCTFDVVTPTRIFRLQADTQADMDAWIASISGTAANEQQHVMARKRNVSHAALRGLTEEDRLKIDDTAKISHENAELAHWPKWNAFEVAAWLQTFGMARFSADFYNAGVTGEKFKSMDDAFLKSVMPEGDKGDRVKILAQVKKLISETRSYS